jgi:hypothetical protein
MRSFDHLFAHIDKEAVLDFFAVFSRFECALKCAGYTKKEGTEVEPNWYLLAADLRDHFDPGRTDELTQAVDYFLKNPPQKQSLDGGVLGWVESSRPQNEPPLLKLVCFVRTVRNNLFHGGKHLGTRLAEPARDTTLLRHGLTILGECLILCESHIHDVFRYFHKPTE